MAAPVKTLTFHSKDLGSTTTLLLTFDPPTRNGIYKGDRPVAWRVCTFGPTGPRALTATYEKPSFVKPQQAVSEVVVKASTCVELDSNQSTELTQDGDIYQFSPAGPGPAGPFQVWNETGSNQGIGIAAGNKTTPPSPLLSGDNVGSGSNVTAQFTPVLKAYVTSNYQDNQILQDTIQSESVIWQQDLTKLGPNTSFTLTRDSVMGLYKITQDAPAFEGEGSV